MSNYRNELEQFIYEKCIDMMWEKAAEYIQEHPYALDLSRSRIQYPTSAILEDMLPEFSCNVRIDGDVLSFDVVVSCTIQLIQDTEQGVGCYDLQQWLAISCEAVITYKLERLDIIEICPYQRAKQKYKRGNVSSNIVPLLKKDELETEAENFLKAFYPEALQKPMRVPIVDIARAMKLTLIQDKCITEDLSIFGEICFSSGQVPVYDLFKNRKEILEVTRGTILIDPYVFWERNLGCVNNTIAHEVYHWYKHRMYAAIKQILRKENMIACRCPTKSAYPAGNNAWTDEQRMEWQASSLAPRILMPLTPFKAKVNELYEKYSYAIEGTPNQLVLQLIADQLASFYAVSRQSVLLRMQEAGYPEAMTIYEYELKETKHYEIEEADAFFAYSTNAALRELLDCGLFVYVQNHFVINDSSFVIRDDQQKLVLTSYSREHFEICALSFSWLEVSKLDHPHVPGVLMHRANANQRVSHFEPADNQDTIVLSEELQKKRAEFEKQNSAYRLTTPQQNGWQLMGMILTQRNISISHFCSLTGLDEVCYRRAMRGAPNRPTIETIMAFACGLDLDMATTQKIMQLSSHAFDESHKHHAYRFCITGFSGRPLDERNEFLKSYGYEPLGSKQKM